MDNKVYAVKCPDYDQAGQKVNELLDMMGGIGRFVRPGEKTALKVNLLLAAQPEKAVTTHPSVAAAVARLVKKQGASPLIVDSPGGGYKYDAKSLDKTYRASGMDRAAEESGAAVNQDFSHQEVSFPQGRMIKRFEVISPIATADAVINLCKLKTHMFTYMTGAVKNHFGVIPGLAKPGYHAKLKDTGRFATMLLDLTELVGARLHLMDAVLAMEGEGPFAGEPRRVGLLLASTNPVALDAVGGEIIGLARDSNPVLVEAARHKIEPNRLEDVELIGLSPRELRVPKFKTPATYYGGDGLGGMSWIQRHLVTWLKDGMAVKPKIDPSRCKACGVCVKACPMKAVSINGRKHAVIRDDQCIRCYCCHEMCPEQAVKLQRGLLYRIIRPV